MPKAPRCHSNSGWVNKFWLALEYNDQRTIRNLIASGVDVNHVFREHGHRRHGQTAVTIAVSKNNRELVRLLISSHCSLEQEDSLGETPLFTAVRKGKLPMIRELIAAECNVNHLNKKQENVLFTAISLGRRDLVEYFISVGVNVDIVNSEGSTPVLFALELYENFFHSGHATRRSAPSNMTEIITVLVPQCSCLNHQHPNRGTALRIALNIEAIYSILNLKLTKLLMQHGAIPDRCFFLRYGGLVASNTLPGAEFFTDTFFDMSIIAGASLQKERSWLATVLNEMPEVLGPHLELFNHLLQKCSNPMPLQSLCIMTIRKSLKGPLWKRVNALPLPIQMKEQLKLKLESSTPTAQIPN